jgi:isopenicillin-N epimerase
LPEAAAIEAALLKAATKRTKLVVLDQITSPSAALLPVQRLIRAFAKRGIPVFVDGAHAAGMLESPCPKGAAWWTTNLHKWGLAPVSSAVLWTSTSRRASTRPLAPSHAHFDGYQAAFAWQGTRDISPWLTAPDAINWVHDNGGWPALRRHNALLGAWAGEQLTQAWGTPMSASPDMREGLSMVAVQLPRRAKQWSVPERLRDALANQFQVEAPIWKDGPRWWVRVSCQAYTRPADIRRLINGLESLLS